MRRQIVAALAVVALGGPARADVAVEPAGTAVADGPRLRLQLKVGPSSPEDPTVVEAKIEAITLVDARGAQLWRRPPPAALRGSFTTVGKAARAYQRDPRAPLESLGLFPGVTLVTSDFALLVAQEQLLVFARRDGKLLFTEAVGVQGFGALNFQHADVELRCGARQARRRVGTTEYFLLDCGSRVLFYFVQGLVVFSTAPWRRLTGHMFPDVPRPQWPWTFPFDGGALTVRRID